MDFEGMASETWALIEDYMENECGHLPEYLTDVERGNLTNILINFAREAYDAGRATKPLPNNQPDTEIAAAHIREFVAMSQDTDNDRVLKLFFSRPITEWHRSAIRTAFNGLLLRNLSEGRSTSATDEASHADNPEDS